MQQLYTLGSPAARGVCTIHPCSDATLAQKCFETILGGLDHRTFGAHRMEQSEWSVCCGVYLIFANSQNSLHTERGE